MRERSRWHGICSLIGEKENQSMSNRVNNSMKKRVHGVLAALLCVCAVYGVCGNPATVYRFRPIGLQQIDEITSGDSHVFDNINLDDTGRFVSIVGFLAGLSKDELKRASDSFYAEALKLAAKGSDNVGDALALWKKNLDDSRKMGKLEKTMDKVGLAITIAEGIVKIRNAKTTDERVTESCRLALHLFTTALDTLTKTQVGSLISDLGDHALDHPEDNGIAIMANWIYDHSSLPQILSEWWYDVRYGDAILVDRNTAGGNADAPGPFDSMPENGNDSPGRSGRYQGLKPIKLL